ncbi:hypothetical protein ACSRUE_10960 [Sorangium sp. KYC3313]|uniref:hypothetical protein n=1 Tax=Sorangium sp. KYC3313 TaxID=3449740 RepID=UPI003F8C62D4
MVIVDKNPFCGLPSSAAGREPSHAWLAAPVLQQRLELLNQEVEKVASSLIGITFDDEGKIAIVVFHTDFDGFDKLKSQLEGRVDPLHVALRPGCFPRERLAKGSSIVEARDWHPKAKSIGLTWGLDASFSGLSVTVDQSAPEVSAALERRLQEQGLGDVVRVKRGQVQRLNK